MNLTKFDDIVELIILPFFLIGIAGMMVLLGVVAIIGNYFAPLLLAGLVMIGLAHAYYKSRDKDLSQSFLYSPFDVNRKQWQIILVVMFCTSMPLVLAAFVWQLAENFPNFQFSFEFLRKSSNSFALPLAEEVLFRGVLLGGLLACKLKFWPANLIQAIGFALIHLDSNPMVFSIYTMFALQMGQIFKMTNSLLVCTICHVYSNLIISLINPFLPNNEDKLFIDYALLWLQLSVDGVGVLILWVATKISKDKIKPLPN